MASHEPMTGHLNLNYSCQNTLWYILINAQCEGLSMIGTQMQLHMSATISKSSTGAQQPGRPCSPSLLLYVMRLLASISQITFETPGVAAGDPKKDNLGCICCIMPVMMPFATVVFLQLQL